jgi:hypothetical protein
MIGHYLPNNNENATVPFCQKKIGTKLGPCMRRIESIALARPSVRPSTTHRYSTCRPAYVHAAARQRSAWLWPAWSTKCR